MTATQDPDNGCLRIRLLPYQVALLYGVIITLITAIGGAYLKIEQALPSEQARKEYVTKDEYLRDRQEARDWMTRIETKLDRLLMHEQ